MSTSTNANDFRFNVKKAKQNMRRVELKLKQTSITSDVDSYSNSVANLYKQGRSRRDNPVAPGKTNSAGGGVPARIPKINIPMLSNGPISEFPNLLEKIQGRPIIERWLEEMIPESIDENETYYMINPVDDILEKLDKIQVHIGANLEMSFPSPPEIFLAQSCTPAVLEFFRYVIGLMEQFYQQTESSAELLRGRNLQMVVKACRLCVPSDGIQNPRFDVEGSGKDSIIISANYVVNLSGSAPLIAFQSISNDKAPEIRRELTQDTLTMWRNDLLAHRLESSNSGKSLLLTISLLNPPTSTHDVFED